MWGGANNFQISNISSIEIALNHSFFPSKRWLILNLERSFPVYVTFCCRSILIRESFPFFVLIYTF